MSVFEGEIQMAGTHRRNNSSSSYETLSQSSLAIEQRLIEISQVSLGKGLTESNTFSSGNTNCVKYATQAINETTFKVCF